MAFILNGKKRGLAYCNGKRCLVIGGKIPQVETLSPPKIFLGGDTLTITIPNEQTETFVISVDGVEMATVEL